MSTSQELFNSMKTMWDSLEENDTAFAANGNKAAGTRARKAAG